MNWKAILAFVFDLEETLYPLSGGGRGGYAIDEGKYGNRDWFGKGGWRGAFVFWWRQLWHFNTGAFFTIPMAFISPLVGPVFFLGFISSKEWHSDRVNLGLKFYGHKEIVDILAHVAGATAVSLLVFYL